MAACIVPRAADAAEAGGSRQKRADAAGDLRAVRRLSVILNGPNERVFMTREEYQQLEAEAARKPPTPGTATGGAVERRVRVHDPGEPGQDPRSDRHRRTRSRSSRGPLALQGVAVHSAMLDGKTAPIARTADGQVVLFLRDTGRIALELELHSPVIVAAAQQSLQFRLPRPAARHCTWSYRVTWK